MRFRSSLGSGACLLLLAASADAATVGGGPVEDPPKAEIFGFADLHVHPATHFSFGRNGGDEGLFWGKPGMAYEDGKVTIDKDLKACAGGSDPAFAGSISHGTGIEFDLIRHGIHQMMVQALDSSEGYSHGKFGAPSYDSWPHSRSLLHQQMHVTMLHRAWEGGLRLIVAAAMDTELLTRIWEHGLHIGNVGMPHVDPEFDYETAKRQLGWTKKFVEANSSWMKIVRSSSEAKKAIQDGKLAVVLAVELDSLTADQILDLVKNYGVRSAIPIHLADNAEFGGCAVYGDLFNTSTNYLTGSFFKVSGDPLLAARLSPDTADLQDPGGLAGFLNAQIPTALKRKDYCKLGYECCADAPHEPCVARSMGHKNARGMTGESAMRRLMKAGVIVDIVHMGEKATEGTLKLAEKLQYPVMNSHSGLRDETRCGKSERHLRFDHTRRMAKLGGVLGFSTEGHTQPTNLLDRSGTPVVRFTGQKQSKTWNLRLAKKGVIDQVKFDIRTGGDDLRDARSAWAILELADDKTKKFILNADSGWGNDSNHSVTHSVNLDPADLKGIRIHTDFDGDNWNVNRVVFSVRIDGQWVVVKNRSGEPLVRLTGERHDWATAVKVADSASLNTCTPEKSTLGKNDEVARLSITVQTGGDDLRGRNDNAFATVLLANEKTIEFPLNDGVLWPNGSVVTVEANVPAGTKVKDLKKLTIRTTFQGGVGGDNWNIDGLVVRALADPLPTWIEDYAEATELMGGRNVAIGSDLNGLAPQFPFSRQKVSYPIEVAKKQGVANAKPLKHDKLGTRTFHFSKDGVAHIGLYPEFVGALSAAPKGDPAVTGLFRSANDFVEMWKKIEEAAKKID